MDEFSSFSGTEESIESPDQSEENFAELFEASQRQQEIKEGEVVDGTVVAVGSEYATVDIGYKCEGLVPIQEFKDAHGVAHVAVGDVVSVYLERMELENGFMLLSKDKAEIIRAWDEISHACEKDQLVEGTVIAKVKGGLSVDIGVKAFLPGSQIDTKPVKNLDKFLGKKLKFKIIKFNKKRGNIVLSRRAVVAQERELQRAETLSTLQEGMIVSGTVKNITEYGAFIDLGGMDGLLHITDMSWGRIKHPSELFAVGDEIKVKILKYDREKERVSLGLKQVSPNPWDDVEYKFPVGVKVKGKVVSVKDYGAFVELEDGIEGLIHVSEMSWTERVKHPSKLINVGDEVECKVLEVDPKNKRISLGLKQLQQNPWDELEVKFPVGTIIEEGEVKSVTDFGVFIDIGMGIDGLVHISDIAWTKKFAHPSEKYKKGDKLRAVVLGIDKANEKFSLGVKQLERDPWDNIKARYRQGQAIDGLVTKLTDFGAFVEIEEGVEGLVYVSEIADHRIEKPSDALKVGDKVRAEILSIEPKERRIGLSIKQLGRTEERANYDAYVGERSKKTSMGDILGDKLKAALNKGKEDENG
ncbi:MAG: 30S ribosomal protein S1 [Bdellovibrionales bacterium RIFOXYC1_FULL_54_43]|nr:MAG: 30S ribosomal protein S1 [Bdellovibrionales bacterium RIFOXYC1_FULL_54_43]OFZ78568.1 MAG: 30S ribosomal protein S1 [Bdellovibrionales bacterium RIFOXYD1_FULL_55_31]